MVSQDYPKESASNFLRTCLVPHMDNTFPVRSEDYGMQFQLDSVPLSFHPLMEQMFRTENTEMVTRCLMNREAQEENSRRGFSYVNGQGLSLTLGSRFSSELQKDRQANAIRSDYESNDCNIYWEGETNGRVYNTVNHPSTHAFHGMAPVVSALQNSPYMKPAQQLLDEVVCISNAVESGSDNQVRGSIARTGRNSHAGERMIGQERNGCFSEEKQEVQMRITKLASLLDELESRCENYFHEMDSVVSSFEAVAGRGAAASYTALTVQAMSKHFSNLRDAIITQLNASTDSLSENQPRNHEGTPSQKSINRKKRGTLHHLGMIQIRQVWRPLRGLPETSVALLRAWLFEHFLHPYPSDNEKLMLASQTGLSRNQISNWFINARVRLWKPMIEEMYREELAEDTQESEPSSDL